jgi:homoserine O-acetyltransferase/O-succinyltransferase
MIQKFLHRFWPGLFAALIMCPAQTWTAELDNVEVKSFTSHDFKLENGQRLPVLTIAYETYGTLAPDGRNAVLITHGGTGNFHAAGRYAAKDAAPGSWDALIGPGKAIDTDRWFVVSSNNLGSSYGTTSPASLNPATGTPYGPDFPDFSLVDVVNVQRTLLEHLGVQHLVAVAGPSFGGFAAFQWGVTYPDFMDGIVVAVSAPPVTEAPDAVDNLVKRLATDPNWNGGWYYDRGGVMQVMTSIRMETLKRYGIDEQLKDKFPDVTAREDEIRRRSEAWAKRFDANSLVVIRRAAVRFDAEKDLPRMKAKLLYVLCTTDKLFPPSIAPAVMEKLKAAGVDAAFFELKSELGHSASGLDAAKWAPTLKAFMDRVAHE